MPRRTFLEESSITSESGIKKIRSRAASLALFANVGLTLFKLIVGLLSGSMAILSEAIHSFWDLVSSAIAFFSIKEAGKPADKEHPFGHGKIETLSSFIEALLLGITGVLIFYESFERMLSPTPISYQWVAIATMGLSAIISYGVYRQNIGAARITESPAIRLNALHFLSDVISSLGILFGLLLLKFTGWLVIDAVIAMGVSIYIFSISVKQTKNAVQELIDFKLPEEEVLQIKEILMPFTKQARVIGYHDLRTRKSGTIRHIDFHLVVCAQMSVSDSHKICDEIEEEIWTFFPKSSINIHVEPCEAEVPACQTNCCEAAS